MMEEYGLKDIKQKSPVLKLPLPFILVENLRCLIQIVWAKEA